MSLRLGDIAPNFQAKTSIGDIDFYEFLGDSCGILFSHPSSHRRSHNNVLRLVHPMQRTDNQSVDTPADWKEGEDVIVVPSISTEDAQKKFPKGVKVIKPYLRYTPQPNR